VDAVFIKEMEDILLFVLNCSITYTANIIKQSHVLYNTIPDLDIFLDSLRFESYEDDLSTLREQMKGKTAPFLVLSSGETTC